MTRSEQIQDAQRALPIELVNKRRSALPFWPNRGFSRQGGKEERRVADAKRYLLYLLHIHLASSMSGR